ncbi:unnamed protein product [Rhodiola kirilowii]
MEDITEKFKDQVVVSLDEDDWKSIEDECKDGFVLKLVNGQPFNLTGLSNVLTKVWNMERRVGFTELDNNMALARFRVRSDAQKIRDGGPWLCLGTFIVMHDWCPDLSPEEFVMNRLGVWAQIHNLPVGAVLKEKEVGEKLAPNIGRLVKVSQAETEILRKRYIRVRVEIDIDRPPVTGFFLERPTRDPLWISVKYERLLGGCRKCGMLNHEVEECSLQAGQAMSKEQGGEGSKAVGVGTKGSRTEAEVIQRNGKYGIDTTPKASSRRLEKWQGKQPVVDPLVGGGGGERVEPRTNASLSQRQEKAVGKSVRIAADTYGAGEVPTTESRALVPAGLYAEDEDIITVEMTDVGERKGEQTDCNLRAIVLYGGDKDSGTAEEKTECVKSLGPVGLQLQLYGPGEEKRAQTKVFTGGGKERVQKERKSDRVVYQREKKRKEKGVTIDSGGGRRYHPYSADRRVVHLIGDKEINVNGNNNGRKNNQISAEVAQLPRREP